MNEEELRSTIEQIKAQVKAKPENKDKSDDEIDEMILDAFYKAYTEGEMSKDDLGGLIEVMGYEFTEEFDQDPEAAQHIDAEEAIAPAEGEGAEKVTQEDLEKVRTMEPGESAEEFKEKIEDIKEGESPEAEADKGEDKGEEAGEEDEDEDEDAQREKASKLWNMDLKKD